MPCDVITLMCLVLRSIASVATLVIVLVSRIAKVDDIRVLDPSDITVR